MSQRIADVDTYIEQLEEPRRRALVALRDLIHRVVPATQESMAYRMPTFEVEGEIFLAMASQKHYMAIYAGIPVLDEFREAFAHLNLGKSCLRFRRLDDLDLKAVRELVSTAVKSEGFC